MAVDAALGQLKQHAGTQFDATIVEAFCEQIARHPARGSSIS
jgi:HD-GYP domain-containing protein (c-di-GMP phosphodiesterase class II)